MDFEDLGQFKNMWRSGTSLNGARATNMTPYAGVLEVGARPHVVPLDQVEHIHGWVLRHFDVDDNGARRITMAIVNKIAKIGIRGKFFVRDNLGMHGKWAVDEVLEQLKRWFAGSAR